jgi:hypothetical protein
MILVYPKHFFKNQFVPSQNQNLNYDFSR